VAQEETSFWFRGGLAVLMLLTLTALAARAQQMPASPVRYTEARVIPVQRTIRLPGSVESRLESIVATEVAGLVEEKLVRDGDTVGKDQPLARLRTTTGSRARLATKMATSLQRWCAPAQWENPRHSSDALRYTWAPVACHSRAKRRVCSRRAPSG